MTACRFFGAGEDRGRHGEAQRFSCAEIDDELEPCRLLDRQIGRPGAFEDLNDVGCSAPPVFDRAWNVGHQTPVGDELFLVVHRRKPSPRGEVDDLRAVDHCRGAAQNQQRIGAVRGRHTKDLRKVARILHLQWLQLQS